MDGDISVAVEVNNDIDVAIADNDIDGSGVTGLDGGVIANKSGWLIVCSALLPNQEVAQILGGEFFTVYSICHSLSKIYVCFPQMSSIVEETKLNLS